MLGGAFLSQASISSHPLLGHTDPFVRLRGGNSVREREQVTSDDIGFKMATDQANQRGSDTCDIGSRAMERGNRASGRWQDLLGLTACFPERMEGLSSGIPKDDLP